jgi:hypothetical protein
MSSSLKQFYKAAIKNLSREISQRKHLVRTISSLASRRQNESVEFSALKAKLPNWFYGQSELHYQRLQARRLYLAYATLCGRDLATVEKNPPPVDFFNKTMQEMEAQFAALRDAANG